METQKTLGIWMDHSTANIIDLEANKKHSIESEFTFETKEEALDKSESLMHNKRQQQHNLYYKKIADEMLNYNHVLLFGPTRAKDELNNYLSTDSHFNDITVDIESSDNMTDNEKDAFILNHFKTK